MDRDIHEYFESINKKIKHIVEMELAGTGIGHSEGRVLYHLFGSGKEGVSQEAICQSVIGLDRSNVGRALKKLENRGYVIRKREIDDARAYRVFLSDKGRELEHKIKLIRANIRQTFREAGFKNEERVIIDYLKRVDKKLQIENYLTLKAKASSDNIKKGE